MAFYVNLENLGNSDIKELKSEIDFTCLTIDDVKKIICLGYDLFFHAASRENYFCDIVIFRNTMQGDLFNFSNEELEKFRELKDMENCPDCGKSCYVKPSLSKDHFSQFFGDRNFEVIECCSKVFVVGIMGRFVGELYNNEKVERF